MTEADRMELAAILRAGERDERGHFRPKDWAERRLLELLVDVETRARLEGRDTALAVDSENAARLLVQARRTHRLAWWAIGFACVALVCAAAIIFGRAPT